MGSRPACPGVPLAGQANDAIGGYENGAEGKPSRPGPLDVCSTEDHNKASYTEAIRRTTFTLRPGHRPVKR